MLPLLAAIWLQPALRSGESTELSSTNILLMAEDFVVLQTFQHEDSEAGACKVQWQDVTSQTLETTLEGFWYCLSPSYSQDHTAFSLPS